MTQGTPEPADREPYPDANQDARVSGHGRAYQAARDQHITEYHYHSERDSGVLDFAFAHGEVANAQDTVERVQESISLHHGLIDFLFQMLRNVQQAVGSLTAERDALREELHARASTDAQLQATRARLDDAWRRLEEAERVQAETIRRLDHVQRQRAEAERLKAEAVEQLGRVRARLADLQQSASTAERQIEEVEDTPGSAASLMGETDQQVVSDILHRVDAVLEREAANLSHLRGVVAESDTSNTAVNPDSLASPVVQLGDASPTTSGATPHIDSDDLNGNTPHAEPTKPKGEETQETAQRPSSTVKSKRFQPRAARLMITRIEPWSVMQAVGITALFIGVAYVPISFSRVLRFATILPVHGVIAWIWVTCLIALAMTSLTGILAFIYNNTAARTGLGIVAYFSEYDEPIANNRRAKLRVSHVSILRTAWIAMVGGLVCGGIFTSLKNSGALHAIASFSDRSVLGRIVGTAGAALAFALFGGLMAYINNIMAHIELLLYEVPDVDPQRHRPPAAAERAHPSSRRAYLLLRRIEPGRIILILVATGLVVDVAYVVLYMSGVLHWISTFARYDAISRISTIAGAVVICTSTLGIATLVNNVCARTLEGVHVVLQETD